MIGVFALLLAAAQEPMVVYPKAGVQNPTAAPATPSSNLPKFEFKSVHAGDPMPRRGLLGCPKLEEHDQHICPEADFSVAGVKAFSAATFYDQSGLIGLLFSVRRGDGPTLAQALEAKYGKPCDVKTTEVQNSFGAKFERETRRWCFADGIGTFESIGRKVDAASFGFTVIPPDKKPVVDF